MQIEKLVPKIAAHDKKSFEQLYGDMSRIVYAVCLGILRDRGAAEEVTQDTFVAVWENIGDYQGKGFKSWIIAIARNKSLNALRRDKREIAVDFTQEEALGGGYTIDGRVETHSVLDAALNLLTADERKIVLLRSAGMKAKEIADLLAIPRGTVSWKYSEALARMKKFLEGES